MILDLSDLDFLDSSGLRCVLDYDAEGRQDGFSLALVPGSPRVQRVFELTQTLSRLTIDQPLRLTASLRAATLRVEVRDEGTRGTVTRRSPDPRSTAGFGLDLVDQLSRAWGVERDPDGTTVWLELAADAHH